MRKEHKFRMEEMELENQRRREDREHETNLLRLLVHPQGPSPYPINPISNPMPHNYPNFHTPLPANSCQCHQLVVTMTLATLRQTALGPLARKHTFRCRFTMPY